MQSKMTLSQTVQAKVDIMCQNILDGVSIGETDKMIRKQFGSGMTWGLFYDLADGSYATKTGHASQAYRAKWHKRIMAMPESERPRKRGTVPTFHATQAMATPGLHRRLLNIAAQCLGLESDKIQELRVSQDGCVVISP